jgi:hypothetical protein
MAIHILDTSRTDIVSTQETGHLGVRFVVNHLQASPKNSWALEAISGTILPTLKVLT